MGYFKVFKEFVTILFLFYVLVSCGEACGISVPFPWIEPTPPALEGKVLTPGLQGSPCMKRFDYLVQSSQESCKIRKNITTILHLRRLRHRWLQSCDCRVGKWMRGLAKWM